MHPIKLLTLLNAKSVKLDGIAGGTPDITSSDVAAALGTMPKLHSALLLWVFVADDSVVQRGGGSILLPREQITLLDLVGGLVVRVWKEQAVRLPPERVERLAWLLLLEIRSNNRCQPCQGRGFGFNDLNEHTECQSCHGSGYKPMSIRQRAEVLGMSHVGFLNHYRRHYEIAFSTLLGVQQSGLSRLHHQFHGE